VPAYAYPFPVSVFGPVAHGSYLADLEDTGWASLSGIPAKLPQTTAPGTAGMEGFVLDERTGHVVPAASVVVAPSTRLSGFRHVAPKVLHPILEVTADRHGAFALLDLPSRKLGYDYLLTAPGYAPTYVVHDLITPGLSVGDFYVARHRRFRRFLDQTPGPPPCGTGC
jgi:hypothetical protein